VLGIVWALVPPLVLMGVYVLVFSTLWKVSGAPHYPLYLLSGLAVWVFFSTSLQAGARSMLDASALIRKSRFPRQLVAFSAVGTNLVPFVVMLVVLLVADFAFVPAARDTEWLAIPLAVVFVALVAGVALVAACLNVVFRDVEHVIGAVLLPWFFLTPVIWTKGQFGHPHVVSLLHWANVVTPPLEAIRNPLFWGRMPRLADVVYLCVAAVVALGLGAWVFSRVDDRIAVEL